MGLNDGASELPALDYHRDMAGEPLSANLWNRAEFPCGDRPVGDTGRTFLSDSRGFPMDVEPSRAAQNTGVNALFRFPGVGILVGAIFGLQPCGVAWTDLRLFLRDDVFRNGGDDGMASR